MEKLLETCVGLASSARPPSAALCSVGASSSLRVSVSSLPSKVGSSSSPVFSNLSWGQEKRTKRSRKVNHIVPASILMEERGPNKEIGATLTILRQNLISAFDQSGLFADEELGQRCGASANGNALVEAQEPRAKTPLLDKEDTVWLKMRAEARRDSEAEPALASYLCSTILAHRTLEEALAFHLGNKLSSATFLSSQLNSVILDTIMEDDFIRECIRADILAVKERDPACVSYAHCLLNFKGYLALQCHRVANRLWLQGRQAFALAMQSRVSEVFQVDIHPGALIGKGILLDHATGVVIGETAVIGDNVAILHHVTLGGTGAVGGDRHPKIGDGVLIGAGAIILGNIKVGDGAKIGAGSVVVTSIPPHTTAVGNPARLVGGKQSPKELKGIPSETMDHTSFWSDYVI